MNVFMIIFITLYSTLFFVMMIGGYYSYSKQSKYKGRVTSLDYIYPALIGGFVIIIAIVIKLYMFVF